MVVPWMLQKVAEALRYNKSSEHDSVHNTDLEWIVDEFILVHTGLQRRAESEKCQFPVAETPCNAARPTF